MTNTRHFPPMIAAVTILIYPGFELLDASGPVSVFANANHALSEGGRHPFYAVEMVSPDGGLVARRRVPLQTRTLLAKVDTFLIAGTFGAESLRAGEPAVHR